MQPGAESKQEQVNRVRQLNEGEKLSLIFTQQRKLGEYADRVKAFECAHTTGQCPLCSDKDLQITQLQQQIKQLKDKQYGRSSERRKKGKKKGGGNKPSQPQNRTRLPSEQFPDARVNETTIEDPVPPSCTQCQQPMGDLGIRESSERVEYQPAELYVQRDNRVKYGCQCCNTPPVAAAQPERLAPGTSLGNSFLIIAIVSKFFDLIPTTRFAKILARGQAAVSHNQLLKAIKVMAFVLEQVYRDIQDEIKNSLVIFADETIHRMLEQNRGQWRWYLWGFCSEKGIVFEIQDTRAGDVSIQFLKDSHAEFLVSDAYSGYNRTIREINQERKSRGASLLRSSLCNDHARRYWFKAQSVPSAEKVLDLYEKIYEIEGRVQELLAHPKYKGQENFDRALTLRQSADPLFKQIHEISCETLLAAKEKSPEAVAATYFLNNVVGLTLYLRHIELPISNSTTERRIRDAVVLRKTSMGNHSLEGANEAAIHLSIMGSCKMFEINPTEYLEFNVDRYLSKKPQLTPYQYTLHKKASTNASSQTRS